MPSQSGTKSGNGARLRVATLAVIAAATFAAVLFPAVRNDGPVPRITGEIQYFKLKRNPAAVPDLAIEDGAGQTVRLGSFRGRVVVLNFWATWCAPCVHEMPSLDVLAARLKGPRFRLVALNEDRGGARVAAPFLARLKLNNIALYTDPDGAVQRALGVAGLPTTVVIDARGREVGRIIAPADWSAPEAVALVRAFIDRAR